MAFATRILVSTDFSDEAAAAFLPARELAEQFGAALHLVHVYNEDVPVPDPDGGLAKTSDVRAHLRTQLEALAAERFPRCKVTLEVLDQAPTAEATLVDYAKKHDVDLIVMATAGHTGLRRLILGSTAESVVRHAHCPVLTVRLPHLD